MNTTLKPKVFVAMSGGVDSSVAAALLKQKGYEIIGIHMKCFNVDGCAANDVEDARRAAETLEVPFYVFDFEKEYKNKVVDYMVSGYKKGITPNPDVMCNKEIKFGLFLKKSLEMGADYVATGHYVRLMERFAPMLPLGRPASDLTVFRRSLFSPSAKNHTRSLLGTRYGANHSICHLYQAKDKNKDQSYFLWTLTQKELKHCLFPIGDYLKSEVRKIAKKLKLPNADKKDSQGICFLGKVSLRDFLGNYISKKKGIVVSEKGEVLGEHEGAHFFTIGQRHGFGGGGGSPRYVAEKDIKSNAILVVEGGSNPLLYKKEVNLKNINLISCKLSAIGRQSILLRVRYRQPVFPATLIYADSTRKNAEKNILRKSASKSALVRVIFDKPQKFVASGQSAVFYTNKGEMLGGGIIV